jgi:hypothetical protein
MPNKDLEKRRATQRETARRYRERHPEKVKSDKEKYNATHIEENRIAGRKYYVEHKKDRILYSLAWNATHKENKKIADKKYHETHREERNAKNRGYAETHREELRIYAKDYYKENPEKVKADNKVYRETHLEELRAYNRKWTKANLAKAAIYRANRKARKQSLPNTFTDEQYHFLLQYWQFSCAVCGRQEGFQWTLSPDHWIPLASPDCPGTIATNMLLMCHGIGGCNNSKRHQDGPAWLKEHFGIRKTNVILKAIQAYFAIVEKKWPTPKSLTNLGDSA